MSAVIKQGSVLSLSVAALGSGGEEKVDRNVFLFLLGAATTKMTVRTKATGGEWEHASVSHRETADEENQSGHASATLDRWE
jgi:hypothetical protein